ncbi:MAG TPA: enoyl-CoA hydratase-related protein [Ilumatobacteraceae bacterium]
MAATGFSMTYDDFEFLEIAIEEGVATVVLNGPHDGNRLTPKGHDELVALWPRLALDDAIRAVVVTGAGDSFSEGPSPELFATMTSGDLPYIMHVMDDIRQMLINAIDFPKPTVAAINGTSMGGVLAFGLLNDIVVAERHVVFADRHVQAGVAAGDGGVLLWPITMGLMRAKRFLLMGDELTAEDAERVGLITEVVDTGASKARAQEYAKKLAAMPVNALRYTKRGLNEWLRLALPAYNVSWGGEIMTATFTTPPGTPR